MQINDLRNSGSRWKVLEIGFRKFYSFDMNHPRWMYFGIRADRNAQKHRSRYQLNFCRVTDNGLLNAFIWRYL